MTAPEPIFSRFNWRHQYDEVADEQAELLSVVSPRGPTRTQMHHAKDLNLNNIMKRYGITDGAVPPMALDPKYFGDFTDAVDFREHLDRVRNATDRFNALPADIRAQFGNDPVLLHDWVSDPENAEEAVKMGLLVKQEHPTPPAQPQRNPQTGREEMPPARSRDTETG